MAVLNSGKVNPGRQGGPRRAAETPRAGPGSGARAITIPVEVASRQPPTLKPMLAARAGQRPSFHSWTDSELNAENVVKAPRKPAITSNLTAAPASTRSASPATRKPTASDPITFTARVP